LAQVFRCFGGGHFRKKGTLARTSFLWVTFITLREEFWFAAWTTCLGTYGRNAKKRPETLQMVQMRRPLKLKLEIPENQHRVVKNRKITILRVCDSDADFLTETSRWLLPSVAVTDDHAFPSDSAALIWRSLIPQQFVR
jgi:hypothetical protein